jgi:hypothetical protein
MTPLYHYAPPPANPGGPWREPLTPPPAPRPLQTIPSPFCQPAGETSRASCMKPLTCSSTAAPATSPPLDTDPSEAAPPAPHPLQTPHRLQGSYKEALWGDPCKPHVCTSSPEGAQQPRQHLRRSRPTRARPRRPHPARRARRRRLRRLRLRPRCPSTPLLRARRRRCGRRRPRPGARRG